MLFLIVLTCSSYIWLDWEREVRMHIKAEKVLDWEGCRNGVIAGLNPGTKIWDEITIPTNRKNRLPIMSAEPHTARRIKMLLWFSVNQKAN